MEVRKVLIKENTIMDTLNLKFRLLLLLVTVGTVLASCAYDDDEKMYS